jgi:plasmid maintenance system antidote protein VapI
MPTAKLKQAVRRSSSPVANPIVDALIKKLKLKNDAELARMLHLQPPVISKIRHGVLGLTGGVLVRMHDITGLSIDELRTAAGLPKPEYSAHA